MSNKFNKLLVVIIILALSLLAIVIVIMSMSSKSKYSSSSQNSQEKPPQTATVSPKPTQLEDEKSLDLTSGENKIGNSTPQPDAKQNNGTSQNEKLKIPRLEETEGRGSGKGVGIWFEIKHIRSKDNMSLVRTVLYINFDGDFKKRIKVAMPGEAHWRPIAKSTEDLLNPERYKNNFVKSSLMLFEGSYGNNGYVAIKDKVDIHSSIDIDIYVSNKKTNSEITRLSEADFKKINSIKIPGGAYSLDSEVVEHDEYE